MHALEPALAALLRVLRDLGDVAGCDANGFGGAAKGELMELIHDLQHDPAYAIDGADAVVAALKGALDHQEARKRTWDLQYLRDQLWERIFGTPPETPQRAMRRAIANGAKVTVTVRMRDAPAAGE